MFSFLKNEKNYNKKEDEELSQMSEQALSDRYRLSRTY